MLRNKKVVILLFKFLRTTRIDKREKAKKREIEWAKKHDHESENLLG